MTRIWRSADSEPGVTLIDELTSSQVQAIHAGVQDDAVVQRCLASLLPKFQGAMGACLLWGLMRAIRLPREAALEVLTEINHREKIGTTAIGSAFAIPHTRTAHVERLHVCSMLFRDQSFEFDAIDETPVRGLCIVLHEPELPGAYLRARLDRSPVSILHETGDAWDAPEYRRLMIVKFRLQAPLIEEWHNESLSQDAERSL